MKTHPLIRALNAMMPLASFAVTASNQWHSMTFSGEQLAIICTVDEHNYQQYYSGLFAILPEHEFSITHLLVADIAVVSQENTAEGITLLIEALVIYA
jgi:hypothetical protein